MIKNLFIFDENKCVGCHACIVACVNENGWQPEPWRTVTSSNPTHHPDLPLFYLSMACNHCSEAPCMHHCPALAFQYDQPTGAIEHDARACIGCKYCSWVCPYDAPRFNTATGIIEKCTFCAHRIGEGEKPACASLCPTGALDFAKEEFSMDDALASSPVPVRVGSSLKIIRAEGLAGPKMDTTLAGNSGNLPLPSPEEHEISASKEWPLFSFSLLAAIMVALFVSKETLDDPAAFRWLIPGMGLVAAVLSLLHLGKKGRAWRSVLNIKNSWLSREIFFFVFFLASVITDAFFYELPNAVGIINGILLLVSIDMLYLPVFPQQRLRLYSAQVVFITLSLWLLISGYDILFILFTTFRAGLYTLHFALAVNAERKRAYISLARIWLPLAAIILLLSTEALLPVLILTLGTDVLDRWMFYENLLFRACFAQRAQGWRRDRNGIFYSGNKKSKFYLHIF